MDGNKISVSLPLQPLGSCFAVVLAEIDNRQSRTSTVRAVRILVEKRLLTNFRR